MAQLKYHQATYDLLTQNYIDPQKFTDVWLNYEQSMTKCTPIEKYYNVETAEEGYQKQAERRENVLAWTKLDLYQRPVKFSEENIRQLDTLEQKYDLTLPEAVREWYSLDISPEIMSANGFMFGHSIIEQFRPFALLDWLSDINRRKDIFYFLHAEYIDQGGESIGFLLNTGDNPPVVAASGSIIIELASQFSEFIYFHFWDWYSRYVYEYGFDIYHNSLPSFQVPNHYHLPIEQLRKHWNELTNKTGVRFYDDHTRIWITHDAVWKRDIAIEYKKVMAGGHFLGDSISTLKNLIKTIWGKRPPVFYMKPLYNQNHAVLKAFIEELRRDLLLQVLSESVSWLSVGCITDELKMIGEVEKSQENQIAINFAYHSIDQEMKCLVESGIIELHPDNDTVSLPEKRYRKLKIQGRKL